MKKTLLVIAAMFALVISANAQAKFGVQGAMNLAKMANGGSGESILSWQAGVVFDYDFQSNLYLSTGALYTVDGQEVLSKKQTFSYIQVPLYIGYKINIIDEDVALFAQAGPYAGYCIGSKVGDIKNNIDGMNKLDYGASFGLGTYIANSLKVGFYYDLGLGKLYDGLETQNRALRIGAAWYF